MKIKTNYYAVFYKDGKSWRGPTKGDLFTKNDIVYDSGVENENAPMKDHIKSFLKGVAKYQKKKVKLFRQTWISI